MLSLLEKTDLWMKAKLIAIIFLHFLHIGGSQHQCPKIWHILISELDRAYPQLHVKEAIVPKGYPLFDKTDSL